MKRVFEIDLRCLSLGRILLGLVVFFDILQSIQWRDLYYSELGVLPRVEFSRLTGLQYSLSPYFAVSTEWFTTLLLGLSAVCAFFFMVGWRTRYSTGLLWLLVVSLQERNPWILTGGDSWLRATLFWLIFLPCGEYFSMDRVKDGNTERATTVSNAASFGLVMQVVFIYFWAGLAKYGESYQNGTTLYYIFSNLEFGQPRAYSLLYFPQYLSVISKTIPWLEISAACLLVMPFGGRWFRRLGVFGLMILHLGIWWGMELYHFTYVAVATLVMMWLPAGKNERPFRGYLAPGLSVILVVWTLALLAYSPIRTLSPQSISVLTRERAEMLGLEQLWQLFAPTAPTSTFVIYPVAVLDQGAEQSLSFLGEKRDRPPKPRDPESHVRLARYWRSLVETPTQAMAASRLRTLSSFYARRWGRLYPGDVQRLRAIRLYRQTYQVLPGYEDSPPGPPELIEEYHIR